MKRTIKLEILSAVAVAAMGSLATAQDTLETNLVQNLNVKLTAYVQSGDEVERVKVTNRDISEILLGDTRKGRLQWVSPQVFTEEPVQAVNENGELMFDGDGNPIWAVQVDENGDPVLDENGQQIPIVQLIGAPAYLRILTGRNEFTVFDGAFTRETIQEVVDTSRVNRTAVYSIDQFVLTAGDSTATLQGFTNAKFSNRTRRGVDLGTVGSFKAKANGTGTAVGSNAVMEGTITASGPRPEERVIVVEPPPEEEPV